MFKELNPLLHSELRLAVMSLLISVEEAVLSISANKRKLRQETSVCSWISSARRVMWKITKTFKGKMPCTLCRITPQGVDAFEEYIEALKSYLVGKL